MSLLRWIQGDKASSSKTPGNTNGSPLNATVGSSAPNGNIGTTDRGPANDAGEALDGPDYKRFGMENFGNTCYCNSVLQALYFCEPFRDRLLQSSDSSLQATTVATAGPSSPPPQQPQSTTPAVPQRRAVGPNNHNMTNGHRRQTSLSYPDDQQPDEPTLPPPTPIPANPATLYSALRSLYGHISYHPQAKGVVAPHAFVAKLKKENVLFRSSMHQDAHEFLNYLLNKIVEDLEEESKVDQLTKSISSLTTSTSASTDVSTPTTTLSSSSLSATPPPSSPPQLPLVQSLFQGTLTNETRCLTCERVTSRSEPFLDLSLDIEQNSSLNACLRGFSKSEMLTAKNKFFCDQCCGLVEAEKRMKIKTLPPILLLHLKRFKYQEDTGRFIKLSYRVAFPLELRLYNNIIDGPDDGRLGRNAVNRIQNGNDASRDGQDEEKKKVLGGVGDPEGLYRLFAVVVHIGGGPHHGHYVTLVKTKDNQWLLYDDDAVEVVKESDLPKYFGDSNFTIAGAVNPVPPQPAVAVAPTGGSTVAAGATRGGAAAAALSSFTGAGGNSSSGVGLANLAFGSSAGAAAMLSGSLPPVAPNGGAGGAVGAGAPTTTAPIGGSGTASGYVLFYQAVDIDAKAFGLVESESGKKVAAASVEGARALKAAAMNAKPLTPVEKLSLPPPLPLSTPVLGGGIAGDDSTTPTPTKVHPPPGPAHHKDDMASDDERAGKAAMAKKTGRSLKSRISIPSLSSASTKVSPSTTSGIPSSSNLPKLKTNGTNMTLSPTSPSTLSPMRIPTITSSPTKGKSRLRGLSLDMNPPSAVSTSVSSAASTDGPGLSPLASKGAVEDLNTPTGGPSSQQSAGAFFRALKPSTSNGGTKSPSPTASTIGAIPVPPIPPTNGHHEKERSASSGAAGWFSTARKSVKRSKKDKDKNKDKTGVRSLADGNGLSAGEGETTPSNGAVSPAMEGLVPPAVPFRTARSSSSSSAEELVFSDDASASKASSGGALLSSTALVEEPEDLDSSTPLATLMPHNGSAVSATLGSFSFPPSSSTLEVRNSEDGRNAQRRSTTDHRSRSPLRTPSPGRAPSSPSFPGLRHKPRKSTTLFDPPLSTSPNPNNGNTFSLPIPRPNKHAQGEDGSTLMKRASRKMSLTGGSMRLSGFGWGKDKERDRAKE